MRLRKRGIRIVCFQTSGWWCGASNKKRLEYCAAARHPTSAPSLLPKEGGRERHSQSPIPHTLPPSLGRGTPEGRGLAHRTVKRTIRNNRYRVSSFRAKPRNPFRLRSNNLCEYSKKRETCYPQLKSAPSGQLSQRGRLRYARSAIQNFAALLIFMRCTTTPNPTT